VTKTEDKVTKLLTPSQVAELEGVTRKTIGKWIDTGKIPAEYKTAPVLAVNKATWDALY
jgi:predicted site-specific integrase-resolvase